MGARNGVVMIRVLVVGDIRLYREGLASRLGRIDDIEVSESSPDEGLLGRIGQSPPDVLLLDMSTDQSLDLVYAVADLFPEIRVVAVGVRDSEDDIIPCAEAGIAGYLPRDGSLDDLVEVVDSIGRGESVVSRRIAASLLRRVGALATGSPWDGRAALLTPREGEIASMLEQGLSNKQIARTLGIRVPTVKNHVHAILGKLQIPRRGRVGEALRQRSKADWRSPARWRHSSRTLPAS